jgi:hypothetical protein
MATLYRLLFHQRTYFSFCTISTSLVGMQARLLRKKLFLNLAVTMEAGEQAFVWGLSALEPLAGS